MFALDLFNTKYEKELREGAVDNTVARLIEPLSQRAADIRTQLRNGNISPAEMKTLEREYEELVAKRLDIIHGRKTQDECMGYGDLGETDLIPVGRMQPGTSEYAAARDRYVKYADSTPNYAGGHKTAGPTTVGYKKTTAKPLVPSEPEVVEAGIEQDLVTPQQRVQQSTPQKQTPVGKVVDTAKQAAKWLAGKGGPGREGPTYEGKDDAWQTETPWKEIPKAKSGRPVDPRGEVTHLSDIARREAVLKAHAQKKNSKEVTESQQLHQGDPIVVTAPNEFEGATGEIYEFSPSGSFVIVDLYNHGKHSMHLSDVEYNQYADDQEEDDWYDDEVNESDSLSDIDAMRQDLELMNDRQFLFAYGISKQAFQQKYRSLLKPATQQDVPVEEGYVPLGKYSPTYVCLAGKPVKKFDFYEDAERYYTNWKQKLYREGNKEKADKITLLDATDEVAPPGAKAERMVKHIKKSYSKDGKLTPKEKAIAYATTWKAHNDGKVEEDTGSWIVYDPQTRQIKKRFKTHSAGKSYAKTHGLEFASSEFYFDTVKEKTVDEGEVIPFRRSPTQQAWQKITPDVLQLANDWFWATQEDSGLQAVTDPKGYGQGTANEIKYVQAKLQSKGWAVDFDDEIDNIILTNRQGQPVALPVNDAYDGKGWATGTLDEAVTDYSKRRQRERDVDAGRPVKPLPKNPQTDYARKRAQEKRDTELGEGADLINMSDLQFYKELLGVMVIPVAAFGAMAWNKAMNAIKLYRAEDVITALQKKGVTVDRSTFEQIKPLLLKLKQAIDVDKDGDVAKELAKRIQQTVTWGKLKQASPKTDAKPTNTELGEEFTNQSLRQNIPGKSVIEGFTIVYDRATKKVTILHQDQLLDSFKYTGAPTFGQFRVALENKLRQLRKDGKGPGKTKIAPNRNYDQTFTSGLSPLDVQKQMYQQHDQDTKDYGITSVANPGKWAAIRRAQAAKHDKEAVAESLTKEPANRKEYLDQRDKLFRMLAVETNPANKQIIKTSIKNLDVKYGSAKDPIREESSTSSEAVEIALIRRILVAHTDLIMEFGLDKVTQAIEEVAYNVGDVDEIGTSDVSAYVNQVKQILGVPEELDEKWSEKYKRSINCASPKGFSQRAHCASKKK